MRHLNSDAERAQGMATMKRIMEALRAEDGHVHPPVAVPSLLYTVGYLLAKTLDPDEEPPSIEELMQMCLNDIMYAMKTSVAFDISQGIIDKAKGD